MKTIIFAFLGRRENIQLQMPYIRRVLDENPDVEYHAWDLSRTPEDHAYIQSLTGERVTVMSQFYSGRNPWLGFNKVWKHYIGKQYRECTLVKLDDDVVFLESPKFQSLVQAAVDNPTSIVSAKVVNCGACTETEPDLWQGFEALNMPLLDVHLSVDYADMCHRWFFDNWQTVIGRDAVLMPTEDWLSINCIAFTWRMGYEIARRLERPAPKNIAGREFTPRNRVGDEGSVNMLPRLIHEGFVAAHLTFGPQEKAMTAGQLAEYRKMYGDIARQYLADQES